MKKIFLISTAILFLCSNINTTAQEAGNIPKIGRGAGISSGYSSEVWKKEEERLLNNLSPELKNKLDEIKKLDKKAYQQMLKQSADFPYLLPGILYDDETISRNELSKKKYRLELEAEIAAIKYKTADDAAKQNYRKDLYNKLSGIFEIRETQMREEVKYLEDRLKELKASLQERKGNKDEIIKRRIYEMVSDSRNLGWQ